MEKNPGFKNKDEAFFIILSAALELDVKKGHLKWTMSELSRKSKVTRSLIYYYFGRSKMDILSVAIKLIGEELVGLSPRRWQMWTNQDLITSTKEARTLAEKSPFFCPFIVEHRTKDNEVGHALREIELQFLKKLAHFFPKCSDHQVRALFAMYWGLLFADHVDLDVVEAAVKTFQGFFSQAK